MANNQGMLDCYVVTNTGVEYKGWEAGFHYTVEYC